MEYDQQLVREPLKSSKSLFMLTVGEHTSIQVVLGNDDYNSIIRLSELELV